MKEENQLALIVTYYLSKFDILAYEALDKGNRSQTHEFIARELGVKKNTIKNMRDEFDAIHPNTPRKGWHQRPLMRSRVEIVNKYKDKTEAELHNIIEEILLPSLSSPNMFNLAEEYEIPEPKRKYIEGEMLERKILAYKRNAAVVKERKRLDSFYCQSCSFYYNKKIVECHHLKPLYMQENPLISIDDLVTLCPNCHRLAHVLLKQDYISYINKENLILKLKSITRSIAAA